MIWGESKHERQFCEVRRHRNGAEHKKQFVALFSQWMWRQHKAHLKGQPVSPVKKAHWSRVRLSNPQRGELKATFVPAQQATLPCNAVELNLHRGSVIRALNSSPLLRIQTDGGFHLTENNDMPKQMISVTTQEQLSEVAVKKRCLINQIVCTCNV